MAAVRALFHAPKPQSGFDDEVFLRAALFAQHYTHDFLKIVARVTPVTDSIKASFTFSIRGGAQCSHL